MNPEKNTMAVAARFSAASETYHQAATVQQVVAESLSRWFPNLPSSACILEIGCGTGLLTRLIRRRYPGLWIDVVDVSARMIAEARTRIRFDNRVRWRVADVRSMPVTRLYPLIVSSSSLHWISPLEDGLIKMAALLEPGGQAMFSLMIRGTLGELRKCRLRVAPRKPPAGKLPTRQQVRQALQYAGLTIIEERKEIRRVEYPSAEVLLRHIHDQGLTGGMVSTSPVPLNRSELSQLARTYQEYYSKGAGVIASYQVTYFMTRKDGG